MATVLEKKSLFGEKKGTNKETEGETHLGGGNSATTQQIFGKTPLDLSLFSPVSQALFGGSAAVFMFYGMAYGTALGVLSGIGGMPGLFCSTSGRLGKKETVPVQEGAASEFLESAKCQGQEMLSFAVCAWQDTLEQGLDVVRFAQNSLTETNSLVKETEEVAKKIIETVAQTSSNNKVIPLGRDRHKRKGRK